MAREERRQAYVEEQLHRQWMYVYLFFVFRYNFHFNFRLVRAQMNYGIWIHVIFKKECWKGAKCNLKRKRS